MNWRVFLLLMWSGAALSGLGCDDSAGAGAGLGERDAAEDRVCRLNSDCPPGYYCKDRRCDLDCRTSRDCPAGQTCESGECLGEDPDAGHTPMCTADRDCDPPDRICVDGACVSGCTPGACGDRVCSSETGRCEAPDCVRDGCPDGETCDPRDRQCRPAATCTPPCADDEYCDPDLRRCVLRPTRCTPGACPEGERCNVDSGNCEAAPQDCTQVPCELGQVCDAGTRQCRPFDCAVDGCPANQRCEAGACVPDVPAQGALGAQCDRAFECASDFCVGSADNPALNFCTQPCCSERDCPDSFGCVYWHGLRICVPAELTPTSNFDVRAGGRCDRFNDCRTGICSDGRCLDSCCTARDCGVGVCEVLPSLDGSARAVCDTGNLFGGGDYAGCSNELECINRLCVFNPEAGPNEPPGYCAPMCCTDADCGGNLGCGQVAVGAGSPPYIVSACVPLERGPAADGAACVSADECVSGHCTENVCRSPCCTDRHCMNGERCLPAANGEGTFIRVCMPPRQPED